MHTEDVVSCWIGELSKKSKDVSVRNGVKTAGQENFSWFRDFSLQRSKSVQAGGADEVVNKQQQGMNIMIDMMRKGQSKGRNGRKQHLVEEEGGMTLEAGQPYDRKCRMRSLFLAPYHKTDSLERRCASARRG